MAVLNDIALRCAKQFVSGAVSYDVVSRIMNQIMPAIDFSAPEVFWKLYVAFENFETMADPQSEARAAIADIIVTIEKCTQPSPGPYGSPAAGSPSGQP